MCCVSCVWLKEMGCCNLHFALFFVRRGELFFVCACICKCYGTEYKLLRVALWNEMTSEVGGEEL